MLTNDPSAQGAATGDATGASTGDATSASTGTADTPSRLARALRIEWSGQTVASVCWIASVFAYGIESTGDWLQLAAATSWLGANIAALVAKPT